MELQRISDYIETHKQEMISDIISLMKIDSSRDEAKPGKPYGEGPALALKVAGELAQQYGFTVKNHENYVLTADFSDKEACLDILAHMDVVPGGKGWTVTEPFVPVVTKDRIYGRGSCDDKGPAVAALYAMRAIRELDIPITKNVRLILGADEECGSSDLEYYYQHEEEAPMCFSPDADFPLVNVEKGRFAPLFGAEIPDEADLPARVISFIADEKINVVPSSAEAVVCGISSDIIEEAAQIAHRETKVSFSITEKEEGILISAAGQAAHASLPENGNNAATALIYLLTLLPLSDGKSRQIFHSLAALFPHHSYDGAFTGIKVEDEVSGPLTISFDIIRFENGKLKCQCDSRVPVCTEREKTIHVFRSNLEKNNLSLYDAPWINAHQVSGDSDFVKTLIKCYEAVSKKPGKCLAIGGMTYVHELKNGVAFGCAYPEVDNNMHGPDEFAEIQNLLDSAKMFALAIAEICK